MFAEVQWLLRIEANELKRKRFGVDGPTTFGQPIHLDGASASHLRYR